MGTSGSYGGPKGRTPLVPAWLDTNEDVGQSPVVPNSPAVPPQTTPPTPPPLPELPPENSGRFTSVRNNFSRFISSGGRDTRSLGRSISGYVSTSSGGAKQAARRMGTSRRVAARLVGFLTSAIQKGAAATLRALHLDQLAGHPIEEIFSELVDSVCPAGGTVDEGIAREAVVETIAELAGSGIADLDNLTFDQLQTILEIYVSRTIFNRLCNDIGAKMIALPRDERQAGRIQAQLLDFIRRAVSDAIARETPKSKSLSQDKINNFVNTVYEQAFEILAAISMQESERK